MDLTIASFVIALLGIVLQISDAFPEHRETRRTIVAMSIGVFIGVAASAVIGAEYRITGNVDRQFALLFTLAGIAVAFGLLASLLGDKEKRAHAAAAGGLAVGLFVATGLMVAAGSADRHYSLTDDELVVLVSAAEQRGDLEGAIKHLRSLEQRESTSQNRDDEIRAKIEELRQRQLRSVSLTRPPAASNAQ